MSEVPYVNVTEVAKLVRKRLKVVFPGQRFSVRSQRYSGGAAIDVGWTDGPTEKDVDAVIRPYAGADFDGMTDSMNYHNSEVWVDGEQVLIRSGAHFVHGQRHVSAEAMARVEVLADQTPAINGVCRYCHGGFEKGYYGPTSQHTACSKEHYSYLEAWATTFNADGTLMQEMTYAEV
jgi:hypothetical protein